MPMNISERLKWQPWFSYMPFNHRNMQSNVSLCLLSTARACSQGRNQEGQEQVKDHNRVKAVERNWNGRVAGDTGGGGGGKRQKLSRNLAARLRVTRLEFQFLHVAPAGWHLTGTTDHHTGMPPTFANSGAYRGLPKIHSHTPERRFSTNSAHL